MTKDAAPKGLTTSEFWAKLTQALGLRGRQRLNQDSYMATSRSGELVQIPDPDQLTAEEREATCLLLIESKGDF